MDYWTNLLPTVQRAANKCVPGEGEASTAHRGKGGCFSHFFFKSEKTKTMKTTMTMTMMMETQMTMTSLNDPSGEGGSEGGCLSNFFSPTEVNWRRNSDRYKAKTMKIAHRGREGWRLLFPLLSTGANWRRFESAFVK